MIPQTTSSPSVTSACRPVRGLLLGHDRLRSLERGKADPVCRVDLVREHQLWSSSEFGDEDAYGQIVRRPMPGEVGTERPQYASLVGDVEAELLVRLAQGRGEQVVVGVLVATTGKPDMAGPPVSRIDTPPHEQHVLALQTDEDGRGALGRVEPRVAGRSASSRLSSARDGTANSARFASRRFRSPPE